MQTLEHAIQIVDELIEQARRSSFSCVSIKAKTIADILQQRTGAEHHAMPTCCHALEKRFRKGRDFFRRGRDRSEWFPSINGDETSTFEVLFEISR
ncbi:MAG: hypothetical protein ACE369_13840 [Roseovarius sp.]